MNVNLNSIGGGSLQERFNLEMEKVVKNMKDPNTSYKEARKIVITLSFKQDEDRNTADCICDVQSKLAKTKSFDTKFGIGRDLKTDQYIAKEYNAQIPGQMTFEDLETDEERIENLKKFEKKISPAIGG